MKPVLDLIKEAKSEQELRRIINYANWSNKDSYRCGKFRRSFLREAKKRLKKINEFPTS